jgi:hypothetical protein
MGDGLLRETSTTGEMQETQGACARPRHRGASFKDMPAEARTRRTKS